MRGKIAIPKEILEKYSDLEYLCYIIAFHAAPTIMRRKAASLIVFKNSIRPLKNIWLQYKEKYQQYFSLEFFCLRERKDSISVLFYHSDLLNTYLSKRENQGFLRQFNYNENMSLDEKLKQLAFRYQECSCPHEIGLFLDYPLHDVKAFLSKNRENYLLVGYWKVYAEEKKALAKFQIFDASRLQILEALMQGVSPVKLTCYSMLEVS